MKLAIKGVQQFAIFPLADTSKVVLIGLGNNDLNGWSWVNNDWLIAKIGATAPVEDDSWYVRRTLGISADGKTINMLGKKTAAQSADDILWIARDGSPHVRMAMQTSIYSNDPGFWPEIRDFDVTNGKSSLVQQSTDHVMDWYADASGTVRYGISYDDAARSYKLLYRDSGAASFRTVSKARREASALGNMPAMFLRDPGKAIAFDDAAGFDALYALDLAKLATGEKLFGVKGYDMGGIITADGGTRLVGVNYTDTRAMIGRDLAVAADATALATPAVRWAASGQR